MRWSLSVECSFLPFWGLSSSKLPVPNPILGIEVERYVIVVVRGVIQVVQNWFTGIPNLTKVLVK